MVLGVCRDCGKQVSMDAPNCPHCGKPKEQRTAEKPREKQAFSCLMWAIVVVIAMAFMGALAAWVLLTEG